jgi:hypothetical protein
VTGAAVVATGATSRIRRRHWHRETEEESSEGGCNGLALAEFQHAPHLLPRSALEATFRTSRGKTTDGPSLRRSYRVSKRVVSRTTRENMANREKPRLVCIGARVPRELADAVARLAERPLRHSLNRQWSGPPECVATRLRSHLRACRSSRFDDEHAFEAGVEELVRRSLS